MDWYADFVILFCFYHQILYTLIGLCPTKKFQGGHSDCQWMDFPQIGSSSIFDFFDSQHITNMYYANGDFCTEATALSCYAIDPGSEDQFSLHPASDGSSDLFCELIPGLMLYSMSPLTFEKEPKNFRKFILDDLHNEHYHNRSDNYINDRCHYHHHHNCHRRRCQNHHHHKCHRHHKYSTEILMMVSRV